MKSIIKLSICLALAFCISGCGRNDQSIKSEVTETSEIAVLETTEESSDVTETEPNVTGQIEAETDKDGSEDIDSMKLYIADKEIPVVWEENDSVRELMEEVTKSDITVKMSMYSDNEQVGSLGRSYTGSNKQMTTHNGDIVLYNNSNIVVFYGSNSWSYTRLGKMQLSEQEVTDLLANGDVIIKLTN